MGSCAHPLWAVSGHGGMGFEFWEDSSSPPRVACLVARGRCGFKFYGSLQLIPLDLALVGELPIGGGWVFLYVFLLLLYPLTGGVYFFERDRYVEGKP